MQSPIFGELLHEQRAEVAAAARERRVARRETLFPEAAPVRFVFIIASGRVKVTQLTASGKEIILRVVGSGQLIDPTGLSAARLHSVTAQAIEACQVFMWEVTAFEDFLTRFPALRCNTTEIFIELVQTLQERFREMATERVPQRLARLLIRLFPETGVANAPIDLTSEELAQMVGTTSFTVCRLLCDWAAQGIIEPEPKAIIVEDFQALQGIAEGTARPSGQPSVETVVASSPANVIRLKRCSFL
jgi:CRP-like cAMP-binding protein